jgi:predicted TPR repeat methyltransferase
MENPLDFLSLPNVEPALFFSGIDASMEGVARFAAVSSACELQLFDRLEEGIGEPKLLAERTGVDEVTLELLLTVLCDTGLVSLTEKGFRNSPLTSTFLVSGSPYTQVHYIRKNAIFVREIWAHLTKRLVEGPLPFPGDTFFQEISLPAMADNALCGRLQRTIREIATLPGFSGCRKMIDLGGGHGLYAIALTAINPGLEAVVFDLPSVTPLAEKNIARFHADRVRTMAGDFFSAPFGTGYDIIFSSSNPSGKSIDLVPVIADALNPRGFFMNVQSDDGNQKNVYQALEWQLWTIGHEEKGKGNYTKERPFLTEAYRQALQTAGLIMVRETRIRDDYHKDASVHLMIARKEDTS